MRVLISLAVMLLAADSWAQGNMRYQNSKRLQANEYLLGSHGADTDPVFDVYRTVDLSLDLGIGSDCGRINFRNTLRATLRNILDAKYLGDMGRDIMAASPMLATCYLSPTWCAILKHSRVRADLLGQMRLDQCAAIDKYTDARVQDYEEERQRCVRQAIKRTGGNFEEAMRSCSDQWQMDVANWAGDNRKSHVPENRLLDSSAEWAGLSGDEAKRAVSLVKAFVGDTVIRRGHVSVDFGPHGTKLTPRTHFQSLKRTTHKDLCERLLARVEGAGGLSANIDRIIRDRDLDKLSDESISSLDRQTIRSLLYLPKRQRQLACRKLADALAMTTFTRDMSRSLDFLTSKVATNPHLPEHRKLETERKRNALKDQIEMTLMLYQSKNKPLNDILYQINQEGERYRDLYTHTALLDDAAEHQSTSAAASFFDCADRILCM